jgi:hypothetical protein
MSIPELLDGFADLEAFAAEVKREPRTVRRWMNEPNGLPYTKLGNRLLIHIPTARQYLLDRTRHSSRRETESGV